jgi:uncharacterized repeat protein (TIGR01451 family)
MLGITGSAVAGSSDRSGEKVTLCHATSSSTNPYTVNTVDKSSVKNPVSGKDEGHGKHEDDIIPNFLLAKQAPPNPPAQWWNYTGNNWPAGEKLLANDCFPLTIKKTGDATVLPGGTIDYSVVVNNVGLKPVAFDNVHVWDPSTDLTPPADTSDIPAGGMRTWTGTRTLTMEQGLEMCGGSVNNTAYVALEKLNGDKVSNARAARKRTRVARKRSNSAPEMRSSTWMTDVICPLDISIAKSSEQASVEPGGTVTWAVPVTNTGPLAIPTATITISDPTATLTPPADLPEALAPGATLQWTASSVVTADPELCGTSVSNTASVDLDFSGGEYPKYTFKPGEDDTAVATPIPVSGGICTPDTPDTPLTPASTPVTPASVPVALRPAGAALGVTKTGTKTTRRGGFASYTLKVTNNGASTATGVVLRDTPPATMLWRAVPSGATVSGRVAQWSIGDLAPGQTVTKTVRFKMRLSATGRICNVALASATDADTARARACTTVVAARRPATPVTG